jgi:hypothetical protein
MAKKPMRSGARPINPAAELIEPDMADGSNLRAVNRAFQLSPEASLADAVTAMVRREGLMPEKLLSDVRGRYAFEHQGDAMMPDWRHGDVAIVDDRDRAPSPPGIFLIVEDGIEVLRRLLVVQNGHPLQRADCPAMDAATRQALQRTLPVRVMTDNPHSAYDREWGELRIIGRVVMRMSCHI